MTSHIFRGWQIKILQKIFFPYIREPPYCGMYRSSRSTAVENLCATILLLQHSAAKTSCNLAAGAL